MGEDLKKQLSDKVFAGATERWGAGASQWTETLKYEIDVMAQCGCLEYMLTCAEVARTIRDAGGVVGPGRGSCAASFVCFALGITDMDPAGHDLIFERFMYPEQKHPTVVCIDTDSVGANAAECLLVEKYAATKAPRKNENWPQWYNFGEQKIGVTATASVQKIGDVIREIGKCGDAAPNLVGLPLDDWQTLEVFWKGETEGIPDFESPEVRKTLDAMMGPGFRELAAAYAFTFPGLDDAKERYLARRLSGARYGHGAREKHFAETYGVLLYGEQLMLAVRDLAGFTRAQADRALRAVTHKMSLVCDDLGAKFIQGCEDKINAQESPLQSVTEAAARWESWCRDGLFCVMKAHCYAYALQAYRLAYLKAHYPSEWAAANVKMV